MCGGEVFSCLLLLICEKMSAVDLGCSTKQSGGDKSSLSVRSELKESASGGASCSFGLFVYTIIFSFCCTLWLGLTIRPSSSSMPSLFEAGTLRTDKGSLWSTESIDRFLVSFGDESDLPCITDDREAFWLLLSATCPLALVMAWNSFADGEVLEAAATSAWEIR